MFPSPFYMCRFTGPPPPSAHLGGGGGGPITRSHFWLAQGEGGDQYNTTTCGMAKDTKDPCISHVDASHADWPRTELSLLFCNNLWLYSSSPPHPCPALKHLHLCNSLSHRPVIGALTPLYVIGNCCFVLKSQLAG